LNIGNRFRGVRIDMGYTQTELADILGTNQKQISYFENNGIKNDNILYIIGLCERADISLDEFFKSDTLDKNKNLIELSSISKTLNEQQLQKLLEFANFIKTI